MPWVTWQATAFFHVPVRPHSDRRLALKPTLPRACETEALVWSTETGWPEAVPPTQRGLPRRIGQALLPAWRPELIAFARRCLAG